MLSIEDMRRERQEALSEAFRHNVVSDIAKEANIPYWAAEAFLDACSVVITVK